MTRFRLEIAGLFYCLLLIVALVWAYVSGNGIERLFIDPQGLMKSDSTFVKMLVGGAAGVAFGLGIAKLSRYAVYKFKWAKGMHIEFRGILGPLRSIDVFVFSLFSSVGEELLFRGALQSSLGIVVASVLFGALHIGPGKKFLPWPFQAIIMGFAFGGLFWLTSSITAPIMAHFVINYQNLHFINSYDPSLQLPKVLR